MSDDNNFASLDKHPAILTLLTNLEQRIGPGVFQVIDHWQGDLLAIGVAHPHNCELLAYIAATGLGDFYIELEVPARSGSESPYSVVGKFRSLSFDQVAVFVADHLAVPLGQDIPV